MIVRELHEGWTLRAVGGAIPEDARAALTAPIPAVVPGCVHVDLLAEGLIPDPYRGENEALLTWIGRVDWTYETTFAWSPDSAERHDLVFDGIDTVARITLNGARLGDVANQHRSYRFPVDGILREGANTLSVAFSAPVPYANAESMRLGARPRPYPLPYEAVRKSAANFGWDWGIATFTSGLWRPVRLESWSTARLAEVRVTATPDGGAGAVAVEALVERADPADARPLAMSVAVTSPGDAAPSTRTRVAVAGTRAYARIEIEGARLWWPVGHGAQPRYGVDVALAQEDDGAVDAAFRRVGFRTVEWETAPDEIGAPFTLVVNGRPIFVKGVNWIPDDALPVRVDRARYERRLRQAVDANLNLVRVWGGGIYESDDFYDLCDELGLLTWQDFLFACAAYPEEEPLRGEIEAEARENILRLASHPSLVLFTGNNENLWGYEDWGWQARLDGRTWGAYYYYDLFPRLIAELAAHVPYAPGSPFSPGAGWDGDGQTGPHPNDERHGSTHLWEQWNRRDWSTYRAHVPRFVAEFGWQGPPAWTTLTRWLDDDPLTPESPGMIVHQKAMEGNDKLVAGLLPHFRVPDDMESWHWAMQLNQALAVRTALEHFRSHAPRTMGAVVWQLNDCWPVTSWAAIDGDERPKPLYYALGQAFAPRALSIQPRGSGLSVAIVNDTEGAWSGVLRIARHRFAGGEAVAASVPVDVPAFGTVHVPVPAAVADADDPASEILLASLAGRRARWMFVEPRDSALPPAAVDIAVAAVDGGVDVTLTARSLAIDLTLLVDKVGPRAVAAEGLLTLLPGESRTVRVHGVTVDDAAALAAPRVLCSANQLVAGTAEAS